MFLPLVLQMEDCVIQIEEEERARRMETGRDGTRTQTNMDVNTGSHDPSSEMQSIDVDGHHYRDELGGGNGWQMGPEGTMDGRGRQVMSIPSSTDELSASFSSRSQSAPEFGRKNTFPFWS
eukprot:XP_011679335.1 PREDICTED: uncharacterized protein LOC105445471 isoform X2 [Strongylocentrotus purpuratus]